MHSFCFENWTISLALIDSVPGWKPARMDLNVCFATLPSTLLPRQKPGSIRETCQHLVSQQVSLLGCFNGPEIFPLHSALIAYIWSLTFLAFNSALAFYLISLPSASHVPSTLPLSDLPEMQMSSHSCPLNHLLNHLVAPSHR